MCIWLEYWRVINIQECREWETSQCFTLNLSAELSSTSHLTLPTLHSVNTMSVPIHNSLILGSSWNFNPLHHWRVNQKNMTTEITGTQIIYLSIISCKHKRGMVVKLHACNTVSWLVWTGAYVFMHCNHIKASRTLWTNHRKQLQICAAKSSHRSLRLPAELPHAHAHTAWTHYNQTAARLQHIWNRLHYTSCISNIWDLGLLCNVSDRLSRRTFKRIWLFQDVMLSMGKKSPDFKGSYCLQVPTSAVALLACSTVSDKELWTFKMSGTTRPM